MQRAIAIIPEFITSVKTVFVISLFLSVILMAEWSVHHTIQDNTTIWQGTCSFKEWNEQGELGMVVDCGEHGEDTMRNTSFIRSYLSNPGPLTCELSASNNINCEDLPSLENQEG